MAMAQQMTNDPQHIAATHELGELKATYKPATMCSVLVSLAMAAFGCFWAILSFSIIQIFSRIPMSPFTGLLPTLFPLFGLLFVVFALFGLISAYKKRVLRVHIYTDGFAFLGQNTLEVVHWQEVRSVLHSVTQHRSTSTDSDGSTSTTTSYHHTYTIECWPGNGVKLDATFARLRELGKTIERETAHYLYPNAWQEYQSGRTVMFGALSVSPQGLAYQGNILPWSALNEITMNESRGFITIKQQGAFFRWANVSLSTVPNIEVFKALVNHITGGKAA